MDIPDNLLEWIINKIEEYIQNNDKLIIDYEEIYYKIICNFLLYYPIYEYEGGVLLVGSDGVGKKMTPSAWNKVKWYE